MGTYCTWGLYKPLHGYHYTYYIHTLLLHMSQTAGSYETCGMQYCPQEWDSTVWVVTSVPSSDNGTDAYQTYAVTVTLQQLATTICTLYSVAISQCHYHTRQPAAAAPDDLRTTATLELSVYTRILCLWLCWRCFLWWCAVYINAVRCTTPRCTPHRNTHNYCEACQYTAVQCEMAILSYNQACCNRKWTVRNMGACNNEAPLHWNYGLATKLQ